MTHDVLFGGSAAYPDLSGTIEQLDRTWVVSRRESCALVAPARTPARRTEA